MEEEKLEDGSGSVNDVFVRGSMEFSRVFSSRRGVSVVTRKDTSEGNSGKCRCPRPSPHVK